MNKRNLAQPAVLHNSFMEINFGHPPHRQLVSSTNTFTCRSDTLAVSIMVIKFFAAASLASHETLFSV